MSPEFKPCSLDT